MSDIAIPSSKISVATSTTPDWYYLVDAAPEDVDRLKVLPGVRLKNKVMQIHRSVVAAHDDFSIVYNNIGSWGTLNKGYVDPKIIELYEKIARPYQRQDVDYISARSGTLLASETGVGKTGSALFAAELSGLKPVLVMGTLLSSAPWCGEKGDPKEWLGINVIHIHGRSKASPEVFDQPNDGWWFIHYDILEAWIPWIFSKLRPKVVIFDEAHKLSPTSKRGRAALSVSRFKEVAQRIVVSATPVRNKRIDLWMPLTLASPDSVGDRHQWGIYACGGVHGEYGWTYNGETHNEELKLRMKEMFIRRTKADVMAYLPPIVRKGIEVELSKTASEEYAQYKAAEQDIRKFLQSYENKTIAPGISGERLVQLGKLLHILSKGKTHATIELAEDTANTSGKCVVFCWFKDVAKHIAKELSKRGITVFGPITGDNPVKHRIDQAALFAKEDTPSVYVATLSSASESINELVAAQDLIINDLYWNLLLLIQAEGRLHRSGQLGSVNVTYATGKNTIDEDLLAALYKKADTVESLGISEEDKSLIKSIGGAAPSDDLDGFVKALQAQIDGKGYGLDDDDF